MADRHGWTHPVCGGCYAVLEPTRMASRIAAGAKGEHCCRCGALTHSGIYYRKAASEMAHCPDNTGKGA